MIHTLESLRARTEADGDCRIWIGAKAGKGYPVVTDPRERYAHRLVMLLTGRTLHPGQQAAHTCGRSLCINPSHLRASTQSENERDKAGHGTANRGRPGVTHCGRYLDLANRCRRRPHDGPCKPDIFEATYEAVTDEEQPQFPGPRTGSSAAGSVPPD